MSLESDLLTPDRGSVPAGFDPQQADQHFAALWGIVQEQQRG